MNEYRIDFANGDYLFTSLNANLQEAEAYYLNHMFNIGNSSDNMQRCIKVTQL